MAEGATSGPLKGIRVLELASTAAGPFCGRLLADFGADVIKLEPPTGDPIRQAGKQYQGKSLYAASLLRNKRVIAVNLKEDQGREIVKALVPQCQILIQNFVPGKLESWGLGYEDLRPLNPALVMVAISGYGQNGPYAQRRGYGVICEAFSGLRHIIGEPDRPPARVSMAMTDYITGLYAALGAMAALNHAKETGQGQIVDAALYEAAFSFLEPHLPSFDKLGFVVNRVGAALPDSVVNNLYQTKDGAYLHVQGSHDPGFRRLCTAMGRPELADDERYATRRGRVAHTEEVDAMVGEWCAKHPIDELVRIAAKHGVTVGRINTMADVVDDPQFLARDMIHETPDEDWGSVKVTGVVPKFSATPGGIRHAARRVGTHTSEVLSELLDYDDAKLDKLNATGVIKCADPVPA